MIILHYKYLVQIFKSNQCTITANTVHTSKSSNVQNYIRNIDTYNNINKINLTYNFKIV